MVKTLMYRSTPWMVLMASSLTLLLQLGVVRFAPVSQDVTSEQEAQVGEQFRSVCLAPIVILYELLGVDNVGLSPNQVNCSVDLQ